MTSPAANEAPAARTWVLVLNYQGEEHIAQCLDSLRRQEIPAGGVRCVVIDNASDDGSLEIVRRDFPEFELIESGRNLGFAGGNNLGIREAMRAGAEYVALLNMDTRVHPRWLRELIEVAEDAPDAGLLGARIHSADGSRVEFDGRQFDPVTTSGGYADRPPGDDAERFQPAAYACGAAVLMRTRALAEVGLLDESFFTYHEDVELSLRCWLYGYRVLNVANAVVYHRLGGAGAGTRYRDFMGSRNLVLTLLKLYDGRAWQTHGATLLSHFLSSQEPDRFAAVCSALFHAPAALRHRRALRRRARISFSEALEKIAASRIESGAKPDPLLQ